MELNIPKPAISKPIGALRVSEEIYAWICVLAERYEVSNQEIVRHILQKNYNEDMKSKLTTK